ncbi:MAG: hypothetical protein WBC93_23525 [Sulfitobacter sp.]
MKTILIWAALALIIASAFWVDAIRLIHNHFALYLIWLAAVAGIAIFLALLSASGRASSGEDEQ